MKGMAKTVRKQGAPSAPGGQVAHTLCDLTQVRIFKPHWRDPVQDLTHPSETQLLGREDIVATRRRWPPLTDVSP